MRLIDADALIESLSKNCPEDTMAEAIVEIFKACVDNEPTINPEPHWIPCSSKLPNAEYGESDNVLATCGYRDVEDGSIRLIRTLYFNGGNWCYPTGETYLEKVYAWMPLPEPWRGDAE